MSAFDKLREGQIQHGYYGNHTSSIDWCELNYTHSPYIAEFVNTLTNVPTMLLGMYGCYASWRGGLRRRFALGYLGLTLVGIGSFGFHASLRWEWQLMDELPMIYLASHAAYLILDTLPTFSPRFGIAGPLFVIAWDAFVTVSYIYLPNPIYHQVAFAGIILSCIARNLVLIRRLAPNTSAPRKIRRTLLAGVATFALGFAVWNVDNVFCDQLRKGREVLGVWGFVLQGHGYWHLMTAYGSFLIFTASIYLQLCVKVSPDAYDYDASRWFPTVYTVGVDRPERVSAGSEKPVAPGLSSGSGSVDVDPASKAAGTDTKSAPSRTAQPLKTAHNDGKHAEVAALAR